MPVVLLLQLAAVLYAGAPASDAPLRPLPVQSQERSAQGEGGDPLAGTEWLLRSLHGIDVDPEIGSSLSFDDEGNVSGNGGCNRFRGGVTIEGQALSFGDLATTMMACVEGEKASQEADYHGAMAETAGFRIENGELSLLNGQDEVVARLTPAQ